MSPRSSRKKTPEIRPVALCYVRQSLTRNAGDMDSPDRQRANIQAVCDRKGYVAEWYTDTVGHKSGRYEKNRPGWLNLKDRIGQPDVAAIIANDLSRLHRKLSRMSDLLDVCDDYDMELILAAPGRDLDTSTPMGRTIAQFIALQDEAYSIDISVRAKDNAIYRRQQGKLNGQMPFGTRRDADGYILPDNAGAWLLADGQWQSGTRDNPPEGGVRWRGYYRCARRILILYAYADIGYEKVAWRLNQTGWLFCDRNGTPRPLTGDDVRRVVANWPEYGGAIRDKDAGPTQSKTRRTTPAEVHFNPTRAVMPLRLLVAVAQALQQRAIERPDHGVIRTARVYPLNTLSFCAHCETQAQQRNNPALRSTLSGNCQRGVLRYRHKGGVTCGSTNRSIPAAVYEADFGRLLHLLTIAPDKLPLLTELAIRMEKGQLALVQDADFEQQKQEAIALCQRRLDAAVHLYGEGRLSREEYRQRIDHNEREIAHWHSRTTDTGKAALELALCLNAVEQLIRVWESGSATDRQSLVRGLFTSVTCDLDTRRITDFRLKPWAERYLVLRATLYDTAETTIAEPKKTPSQSEGVQQDMPLIISEMNHPLASNWIISSYLPN